MHRLQLKKHPVDFGRSLGTYVADDLLFLGEKKQRATKNLYAGLKCHHRHPFIIKIEANGTGDSHKRGQAAN